MYRGALQGHDDVTYIVDVPYVEADRYSFHVSIIHTKYDQMYHIMEPKHATLYFV